MYECEYLTISDEGEATIAIVALGLPISTAILPAPMMSELKRESAVELQKQEIWLRGCFITNSKRVKNIVFDHEGEKSSTEIEYRPCKNQDEAEYVLAKLIAMGQARLDARGSKENIDE